jgi:GntR family transcriptional regulator
MYRQIADDLRAKIESGELEPGGQLPTEEDLKEQYSASRNTIREAIKMLTTPGLVETRAGQGTFVAKKLEPYVSTLTGDPRSGETEVYVRDVINRGRKPSASVPRVEIQLAEPRVADSLRIEEAAEVVIRHQELSIDDTPWSLQTSYYPMSLVEKGALRLIRPVDIKGGTVAYIAESADIKQASYRDSIAVRSPDDNEIKFFRLPADGRIPVFEIFRVAFDESGDRIRLTITVYPADRNQFVVNVGEVPGTSPPSMPGEG